MKKGKSECGMGCYERGWEDCVKEVLKELKIWWDIGCDKKDCDTCIDCYLEFENKVKELGK